MFIPFSGHATSNRLGSNNFIQPHVHRRNPSFLNTFETGQPWKASLDHQQVYYTWFIHSFAQ